MELSNKKVLRLATVFSYVIQAWHTRKEMKEVIRRNKAEPPDSQICHSHDFYDANQAMLDAWEAIYGKEPNLKREKTWLLMGAAWDLAKKNNFYYKIIN